MWRRSSISKKSSVRHGGLGTEHAGRADGLRRPGAARRSRAARPCRASRPRLSTRGGAGRSSRRGGATVRPSLRARQLDPQGVAVVRVAGRAPAAGRRASRSISRGEHGADPVLAGGEPELHEEGDLLRELGLEGDLEARLAQARKRARETWRPRSGACTAPRRGRPAAETRSSHGRSSAERLRAVRRGRPWARARTRRSRCRGRTGRAAGPTPTDRCSRRGRGSASTESRPRASDAGHHVRDPGRRAHARGAPEPPPRRTSSCRANCWIEPW